MRPAASRQEEVVEVPYGSLDEFLMGGGEDVCHPRPGQKGAGEPRLKLQEETEALRQALKLGAGQKEIIGCHTVTEGEEDNQKSGIFPMS